MKRYGWPILFAIIAGLLPLTAAATTYYTDWLWFQELGYDSVFVKTLVARLAMGGALGGAMFALLAISLFIAGRIGGDGFPHVQGNVVELPMQLPSAAALSRMLYGAAAVLSFLMGVDASSRWGLWMRFRHAVSFGAKDPVFSRDIGFYVFRLPFYDYLYQWGFTALVLCGIAALLMYVARRSVVIGPDGARTRPGPMSHLSLLLAAALALKAAGCRLALFHLLLGSRGFVFGAGYADIYVRIPALNLLTIVYAAAAVALAVNAALRSWKLMTVSVAFVAVVSVAGSAVPALFQNFRVRPNEISMEKPYIERQIRATRAGFGLENIEERHFAAEDTLTSAQVRDNMQTVKNIRLWDARPLLSTYAQLQEIRPYYNFTDVDVDRYKIGGRYTQVNIAVRELAQSKLPSRIWINERLIYTHGYGVVVSPVTHTSSEGMPNFLLKDIPPAAHPDLKLRRPEIYYGELAENYIMTGTRLKEFDYPLGAGNSFARYEGKGGVPVRNFVRRAAFALRFSTLGIMLNSDIGPKSRVLFRRTVADRVGAVAPFLELDSDPYPVIHRGRIVWVVDAYTISDAYPYSDPAHRGVNYIRNSVKVTVDAYDGAVNFYIADPADPIIRMWAGVFPGVFRPLADMPADLRAHMRYPMDMFKVQADVFRVYHMTNPAVFYNKEDQWSVPRELFYNEAQDLEPYYSVMKMPGGDTEEYVLTLPFTPLGKDNLASLLCARMDGAAYGGMVLYGFPKKKLIYGPFQIEARIDQDTEISKQFSLWNQRGSQIIRGNMLVVPIDKGLLYAEPVYLTSEKGQIPELKRVVLSVGEKVVMAPTMQEALELLVGDSVSMTAAPGVKAAAATLAAKAATGQAAIPTEAARTLEAARQALREASEASKRGDWAAFGTAMQRLQNLLNSMDK